MDAGPSAPELSHSHPSDFFDRQNPDPEDSDLQSELMFDWDWFRPKLIDDDTALFHPHSELSRCGNLVRPAPDEVPFYDADRCGALVDEVNRHYGDRQNRGQLEVQLMEYLNGCVFFVERENLYYVLLRDQQRKGLEYSKLPSFFCEMKVVTNVRNKWVGQGEPPRKRRRKRREGEEERGEAEAEAGGGPGSDLQLGNYEQQKTEVPLGIWWREKRHKMRVEKIEYDPSRKPGFEDVGFMDGEEELGKHRCKLYNEWNGLPFFRRKTLLQLAVEYGPDGEQFVRETILLFLRHVYMLCDDDPVKVLYLLFWVAWKRLHPEMTPQVFIGIVGPAGVGKSLLLEILQQLFGKENAVYMERAKNFTNEFGSVVFTDKVLIMADEVNFAKTDEVSARLKTLVTAQETERQKKFGDIHQTKNHLGFLFSTNKPEAFPVDFLQRRGVLFHVPPTFLDKPKQERDAYFNALHARFDGNQTHFDPVVVQRAYETLDAWFHGFQLLGGFKGWTPFHNRITTNELRVTRVLMLEHDPIKNWWWNCLQRKPNNLESVSGLAAQNGPLSVPDSKVDPGHKLWPRYLENASQLMHAFNSSQGKNMNWAHFDNGFAPLIGRRNLAEHPFMPMILPRYEDAVKIFENAFLD